jgi:hypothetical protein
MAAPTTPVTDLGRLPWKAEAGFQVAAEGTCLYMRESVGSMIAGVVFAVAIGVPAGLYGGWLVLTGPELSARAFGGLMLVVAAVFGSVLWYSARRGRWMIVYDRGEAGRPGEIRCRERRIPAERVRGISTRVAGRSDRTVIAELHDGTVEVLGPSGVSTWPAHWGQRAASWMGLPFRQA